MIDSSLQRFDQDGIELIINTETGESFASISGYARMSGKIPSTISRRLTMSGLREKGLEQAQIETVSGLQQSMLIPINIVTSMLLSDYNQTPTQKLFESLVAIYKHQGLDTSGFNLHNFNKDKSRVLKVRDREKQIQLAYQSKYGGVIEHSTANGRIDLLTDTTIYEFKSFKNYKDCLGQLLAYHDCIPEAKLVAVLFGVPKAIAFNSPECNRIKSLLNKYGITAEFLR